MTLDGDIDGVKRLQRLVEITLKSPNLAIMNVRFENFDDAAIKFMNAAGEKGRPILFADLQLVPIGNPKSAVFFDAYPKATPPKNDWIDFKGSTYGGKEMFRALTKDAIGDHVFENGKAISLFIEPKAPDPKKGPDPKAAPDAKKGPDPKTPAVDPKKKADPKKT